MTQESKNNVHSDDDKKFTVTDHTEIIRILRGLARADEFTFRAFLVLACAVKSLWLTESFAY